MLLLFQLLLSPLCRAKGKGRVLFSVYHSTLRLLLSSPPSPPCRLCLDVLERQRDVLTPDVWLLPAAMVDRVMARLTAVGSRLLDPV